LELHRAGDAHGAFLRALKSRNDEDRQQLIVSEQERLDTLEKRIRERDAELPEKLERRLGALESLRTSLL
jgi:argininosuccinate lyase